MRKPAWLAGAVLLCATTASLTAQTSRADSAAEGRALWRAAGVAAARDDWQTAHRLADSARGVWPVQPAYVYGAARMAARAGHEAAAAAALEAYVALGLGADALGDPAFEAVTDHPRVRAAAVLAAGLLRPTGASTEAFRVADSTFFPEGIACRRDGSECLLGSVRHGSVVAVDRDGAERTVLPARNDGTAVLAVRLSPDERLLWVGVTPLPQAAGPRLQDPDSTAPGAPRAAVLAYSTADWSLQRSLVFPDDGPHLPGDIALDGAGVPFISDSRGAVYRAGPGDTLALVARGPLLRSPQGLAFGPSGGALYVADYSHGLLVVDPATGAVRPVPTPAGTTLVGIDGLTAAAGGFIAIQNGVRPFRILELAVDSTGAIREIRTLERRAAADGEPTNGVLAAGAFYYVAASQWDAYDDAGARTAAALRPAVVRRIPIPGSP